MGHIDFEKYARVIVRIGANVQKGQDVERRVLAQAVTWYSQRRILLNGNRTVVFE